MTSEHINKLLPPRQRLETLPEGLPEYTLGYAIAEWCYKYLKHTNGIRAGKPWLFTHDQMRFILWFYAIDEDGRWLFHKAARRLAKGSGKSPFAATLAVIELLAPCRFDYFDSSVRGGVIGKRVHMPWVQLSAATLDQTENTMRHVRSLLSEYNAPELHKDYDLEVGKYQVYAEPSGKLEVITSSAVSAEGGEVTFIIADELEHWTPSNGGDELHATLTDNLTKSAMFGSRMVETLNAWVPDINSVGEKTFEDWVLQEEGKSKNTQRILYDARKAPPDTDLSDYDSLYKALEFVYADCSWVDIPAIITRIWTKSAKVDDSIRKYLNIPTAPETTWVTPQEWDSLADYQREVSEGEDIVMFFDGSLTNDNTALVGCCLSDGFIFTIGIWEPVDTGDGNYMVDVDEIDLAVDKAFEKYSVYGFWSDVREWESFSKITWPERYRDDLKLWAVPNGKLPLPIAWDMRSKTYDFTNAAEMAEAEIRDGLFKHDGNGKLAEHVSNARRRPNRYGTSIGKESRQSDKKIDACVCMIGARYMYRLAKEQLLHGDKNTKKVKTGKAFFLI